MQLPSREEAGGGLSGTEQRDIHLGKSELGELRVGQRRHVCGSDALGAPGPHLDKPCKEAAEQAPTLDSLSSAALSILGMLMLVMIALTLLVSIRKERAAGSPARHTPRWIADASQRGKSIAEPK
jgi:hypothetical protein